MTINNTGEGQGTMTYGYLADKLVGNGWHPVPLKLGIDAKKPVPIDWVHYHHKPEDSARYLNSGIGLLTANVFVADIDIYDPELVSDIMAMAKDILPDGLLRRVGYAPKIALVGRWAGQHPGKQATRVFVSQGRLAGKEWKVEILGPSSHMASYAINPDSKKPYEWIGPDPTKVQLDSLPEVTPAQVQQFLEEADHILGSCGYLVPKNNQHRTDGCKVTSSIGIAFFPLETDRVDDIREAMQHIPNDDLPADEWMRICYAVKGALGDTGEAIFAEWSRKSGKSGKSGKSNTPERRYKAAKPLRIGAGTIFDLAKQHGWKPRPGADRTHRREAPPERGLIPFSQFVSSLQPPEYLLDSILQRGWLYCMTARTGAGKTAVALELGMLVALGKRLLTFETTQGRVVYLSGENPEDVKARSMFLGMRHNISEPEMFYLEGNIKLETHIDWLISEIEKAGGASLVIVDTSASYFGGSDDNSNVELGEYARMFRKICKMPCRPTVLVLAHPVKNATKDNMVPRGGGAFLNEVDGNLTLWTDDELLTTLHWQGKIRGPSFEPIQFRLEQVRHERYADSKGRELASVLAVPIDFTVSEKLEEDAEKLEDRILLHIADFPGMTVRQRCMALGIKNAHGGPITSSLQKKLDGLKAQKLVVNNRQRKVTLTDKGLREVAKLRPEKGSDGSKKEALSS